MVIQNCVLCWKATVIYNDRESYSNYGYQEQEFKNNELVNVESDSKETNDDYTDDLYDAYTDDSENE